MKRHAGKSLLDLVGGPPPVPAPEGVPSSTSPAPAPVVPEVGTDARTPGSLDVQVANPPSAREAERPNVQVPDSAPRGRSLVARADGRVRRRMTIYLPPPLARELAMYCAAEGVDLSDVVADAVAAHLVTLAPRR